MTTLSDRRQQLGYTTPAEAALQAGVNAETWVRYERGRGGAHLATARRIARVLLVPVATVLEAQEAA